MEKPPDNTRRTLITLIVILAVVQVAILGYLWSLLRPSGPQDVAQPAPLQFLLPPSSTATPASPVRTATPESVEIVVEPPVAATGHADLARMFDEEQALEHVAYLASDELGGRQPGTPGGRAAGEYVAARFAEYGLEPAGSDGTYFQTFTMPYGRITTLPELAVTPPDGATPIHNYTYRVDYRALTGGYLGGGEGEGQVVWLNQCLHDSYAGMDMVGKIALCRYTQNAEVYRQAIEHRVGGLLLLDRDRDDTQFRRGGYRDTAWVVQTIPAYLISETVARDLLIGTAYRLDDLSLHFTPTPLSATVRMAVTVEEQEQIEARNVLALLPGSDPNYDDEIVVIGAHYDHLGREPDEAIMSGANDNGSGIATVLEIARLWQTQDFRPARSVLFAAWDGEECGLLGSRHYVANPTYPLTATIAMLNLDMVGTGEQLQIDGEGPVVSQLQASAAAYGITHSLQFMGRSDHMSFYEAGVPTAMLIYWPDTVYHTPSDKLRAIEPEKLKAAGVLASHTMASLAEGYVELDRAVERLQTTVAAGDRDAFLAGLDPTDPDLQAAQAAWFDNLWSRELTGVALEPQQMRVGAGEAEVTLQVSYRWTDMTQAAPPVSYDVRFVQRDSVWTFAGYQLDTLAGDVVTVARFPDVPIETRDLLTTAQNAYLALAADLGLEPIASTRFIYYPDAATMQAVARPVPSSQEEDREGWLVSSAGLAQIAWGQPITPALVNLTLNQMGLPPTEGTWLREGLALHYEHSTERGYLPFLVASDALTPLLDLPALGDLPDPQAQVLRAHAWLATEYVLDQYGSDGLRALCAAWGQGGPVGAFQQALGLSPEQFEAAWRGDRLAPLRADAQGIQATLAARVEAVREGNEAAFLSTVTVTDPVLRTEERHWLTDLVAHRVVTYTVTGELVGWSPERKEVTVALSTSTVITGRPPLQATYDARFVREGDRWVYADLAWSELASEHVVIKYQDRNKGWARRVLELAESAYAQVTADLEMTPQLPVVVKVYDDGVILRNAIASSLPDWVTSWTEPGESIRFWAEEDEEHAVQDIIARELTHLVLFAQGLETDWLHEGVATFEADRLRPLGTHWRATRFMPIVQEAVRRHEELSLDTLPPFEELSGEELVLAYAQSWSLVSYLANNYGLERLRQFIVESIPNVTDSSIQAAFSMDPDPLLTEWEAYVRAAGVPNGLVLMAERFSSDRAMVHVTTLTGPEFGGRQAGAPEADLAAAYIAERFAVLGLEPMGDPLPPSAPLTETAAATIEVGYLQEAPISYTHIVEVPTLAIFDSDGVLLHEFAYRDDFIERAGAGIAEGELVWVHVSDLEGIRFGGAVILEQGVDDPIARAAQLQAHGAGGLIVANDAEQFRSGRVRFIADSGIAIPVFELTEPAFQVVLERLGLQQRDLSFAPPTLPLGAQVHQALVCTPLTTTFTANVLGFLPGSDPDLAGEVLIVGAHYDHIGRAPDGFYFPGGNQNASGVAALLEMARVWRTTGFRPARSILFAAWSAEELDSAGVAHYLTDPAVPLTQTVGVIALDRIGNGRGYRLLFYGTRENDLPLLYRIEAGTAQLNRRAQRKFDAGEGWHTLFSAEGIPTVKLIWDGAERDPYLATDTADNVDPERLAFSGEILTLATAWLASP